MAVRSAGGEPGELARAEVLDARHLDELAVVLDAVRQCLIALRMAGRAGLDPSTRATVYYTALLVNVGCQRDAHERAKWLGDDIALKSGKYDHEPRGLRAAAAGIRRLGSGNPPLHRFRLPLMRNGQVDQHALAIMYERRALWAEVVRLAAYTGLRFGELRALRWRDVDWAGRNLHVKRNAPTSAPAKAGRKIKSPSPSAAGAYR